MKTMPTATRVLGAMTLGFSSRGGREEGLKSEYHRLDRGIRVERWALEPRADAARRRARNCVSMLWVVG